MAVYAGLGVGIGLFTVSHNLLTPKAVLTTN